MSNWLHAVHAAQGTGSKTAAVIYIIAGLFLAPVLIGIPLLVYGIYKLFD